MPVLRCILSTLSEFSAFQEFYPLNVSKKILEDFETAGDTFQTSWEDDKIVAKLSKQQKSACVGYDIGFDLIVVVADEIGSAVVSGC